MRITRLTLALLLGSAGCTGGLSQATGSAPIIGGATDTLDPGVVLLFAQVPGSPGGALCTGEVISPHVILTAAHCVSPGEVGANAVFRVFTGSDFNLASALDLLPVRETHFNPLFDAANPQNGNDVGVAILANPISVSPLKINRAPITNAMVGQPVRFVGYGLDNAPAQSGSGLKRQTSTTLSDFTNLLLHFSDGTHETCNGDSGGPAFMNINGSDVIVGLTSFGDANCNQGGFDTRVDAMLSFIDPFVLTNDPAFAMVGTGTPSTTPGANGSSSSSGPAGTAGSSGSGGPTGSTPPAPNHPGPAAQAPSPAAPPAANAPNAALLGFGQSCQHDSDCESKSCGLSTSGTLVCVAASNGTNVNGGCTVGGRGSAPPLGLVLLAALVLLIRRSRSI
jgi:V8-like Glu-specific endopeptidase